MSYRSRPRTPAAATTRRRVAGLALVASVALAATACTDDSAWSASGAGDEAAAPGSVSVLLALDAASADVTVDGQQHSLQLHEPGDVLAFTDRPVREAQRTTVRELADRWDRLFGDDPPNAALTGVTPDGLAVDVPVELLSFATADDGATLTVRRLDDGEATPIPVELERVSLFIDDVTACGGAPGEGAQSECSTEIVYASTFIPFDSSF